MTRSRRKHGGMVYLVEKPANSHPLILGLCLELPPPGSVWPKERQEAWLRLAAAILDRVYSEPEPSAATPKPVVEEEK